jgi:hypothetical protein
MTDRHRPVLPTSRYAWLVGVAAVLVAAFLVVGSTRPAGPGAQGIQSGAALPPFAVVLATADVECDSDDDPCDANVAAEAGQGEAGRRPACDVRGPTVLNLCELTERGPLLLGLMATRSESCMASFDRFASLPRRHRGLRVALVSIRGDLGDLRDIVRARRWRFPVGWDRDGVLASIYGVATCPYAVAARWRGRAESTLLGELSPEELDRAAARVVAVSRAAGWRP